MAATYTEFESIRSTTTTQADATTGPVHIGSLLPQVLARYGIVLPRDQSAVTSARLRRRMRHSHTHQAPAISPRPNSPLQDRPAPRPLPATSPLIGLRSSTSPVQLSLFSAVG